MADTIKSREDTFSELVEAVRIFVPKFKVVCKTDCWLHALIGRFWKHYLKNMWTTVGFTAAAPIGKERTDWDSIPHEGLHALQAKKYTRLLFWFLYLCPQILSLVFVGLSVFMSPWFIFGCLLVFPIPSPFRMKVELEAYILSVMVQEWVWGIKESYINYIVESSFAGKNYYWMWPFKATIKQELWAAVKRAKGWASLSDEYRDPYIDLIYKTLYSCGYIRTQNA